MRFMFVMSRLPGAACLVLGLALSACLAAPPATTPVGAPDPLQSTRPVRIDAATPFPILVHAPLRSPSPAASQAATPAPTAAPASDAPTAEPTGTAPPSLSEILKATALASASPLPTSDAEAVATALADEAVVPLLPADLIHDGGTALYRLAAASPPETSPRPSRRPTSAIAPTEWQRQQVTVGDRETAAARGKRSDEAGAAVGYLNRGTFAFKPADGGETVRKPFVEVFRRQVGLKKAKSSWQPNALGPIRIETQGGQSGLEVARLTLTSSDDDALAFEIGATDVLTPLADLPRAAAGDKLTLEADVRDRLPGQLFVYGRLAGAGEHERVLLFDDGEGPDREAGDGIYTWALEAPEKAGYHHLAIDVLDARCFEPKGPVRSLAVGFTVEVK